ncbi:MAG TPA: DUF899 family protein [Steroidobacteraceae bacterium]|nr:DUF899 family protein [Steroidobacteraceae bacterium]
MGTQRIQRMAVEKAYEFEGPRGRISLLGLFEGRRQLIVYRAFFEPGVFGWPELGADRVAHLAHLNARDTTLAYASRASQEDIARLKARMGWKIPWYTITDSFDADFGVDDWHGHNVFTHDGGQVFRTYFINWRDDEALEADYRLLDLTVCGRREKPNPSAALDYRRPHAGPRSATRNRRGKASSTWPSPSGG